MGLKRTPQGTTFVLSRSWETLRDSEKGEIGQVDLKFHLLFRSKQLVLFRQYRIKHCLHAVDSTPKFLRVKPVSTPLDE